MEFVRSAVDNFYQAAGNSDNSIIQKLQLTPINDCNNFSARERWRRGTKLIMAESVRESQDERAQFLQSRTIWDRTNMLWSFTQTYNIRLIFLFPPLFFQYPCGLLTTSSKYSVYVQCPWSWPERPNRIAKSQQNLLFLKSNHEKVQKIGTRSSKSLLLRRNSQVSHPCLGKSLLSWMTK